MANVLTTLAADGTAGYPTGGSTVTLINTLAFGDTSAKALFTIPAGAYIVDWVINVLTVFNDSGTDQVNIGISGTAAKFASALDVSSLGLKTAYVIPQIGIVQSVAQPILGIYAGQNSNATTGAMVIMCRFFIP